MYGINKHVNYYFAMQEVVTNVFVNTTHLIKVLQNIEDFFSK